MDIEKIIRNQTMDMFSDKWYIKTSNLILSEIDKTEKGYVYFVSNGKKSKNIKIGFTSNMERRFSSFKTTFSKGVFVWGYIKSDQCRVLEKEIHSVFYENRISLGNEFFSMTTNDLLMMERQYKMNVVANYYVNGSVSDIIIKRNDISVDEPFPNMLEKIVPNKYYRSMDLVELFDFKGSASWMMRKINSYMKQNGFNVVKGANTGIRKTMYVPIDY